MTDPFFFDRKMEERERMVQITSSVALKQRWDVRTGVRDHSEPISNPRALGVYAEGRTRSHAGGGGMQLSMAFHFLCYV